MVMPEKEYALYKGDKLLMIGTVKEIAEKRGVKPASIHFLSSPAYLKRRQKSKNALVLVKLED